MYSCEFCEISKSTFFTEQLWATASVSKIDLFVTIANFFQLQIKFYLLTTLIIFFFISFVLTWDLQFCQYEPGLHFFIYIMQSILSNVFS